MKLIFPHTSLISVVTLRTYTRRRGERGTCSGSVITPRPCCPYSSSSPSPRGLHVQPNNQPIRHPHPNNHSRHFTNDSSTSIQPDLSATKTGVAPFPAWKILQDFAGEKTCFVARIVCRGKKQWWREGNANKLDISYFEVAGLAVKLFPKPLNSYHCSLFHLIN